MELTNSLLKKSPTSSVVEGPPIFRKTIAVGPFDPVESWVTGGTTVAIVRELPLYEPTGARRHADTLPSPPRGIFDNVLGIAIMIIN